MTHNIRPAKQTDLSSLATLGQGDVDAWCSEQFAAEWGLEVSKIWVIETMARSTQDKQAIILGCLVRWVLSDEMQILDVLVHPAARRKGFGLLLMQTALAEAQVLGLRKVHLEVRCDNEAALRLYARLNFEVVGRRAKYYNQSGADAVLMTLDLSPVAPQR